MRIGFLLLLLMTVPAHAQQISGRVEAALINADSESSWQQRGTGILRSNESGVQLQQGFLRLQHNLNSAWSADIIANYYDDGEKHLGFSQAFLQYKPLSPNKIKFKSKLGFFYPAMSIENVSAGWLSPYTYTQSSINSWIGEELRTLGGEVSAFSNGRARRSPWSWEAHLGVFKGNDPLGSLLTWRGFATHDRQSLHHDRVNFARLPSVLADDQINGPAWVEPFREIDGRWGAYAGAHLRYFRQSELRYYYYDNRANPDAVNDERLYAWRTKFHSLAAQHNIDSQWRLMAQVMDGSTLMGYRIVYADFTAWYLATRFKQNNHSVTFRYDFWEVIEDDMMPNDQNNSDGESYTIAWRYQWNKHWEFGAEYHYTSNWAQNRLQLNMPTHIDQSQSKLVLAYSF